MRIPSFVPQRFLLREIVTGHCNEICNRPDLWVAPFAHSEVEHGIDYDFAKTALRFRHHNQPINPAIIKLAI